jgi:hypothetical protein
MTASPEEGRAFLSSHREVFKGESDRSEFMMRRDLRREVLRGNTRHWTCVVFDPDTDWPELRCSACAAGLDCLGDNWAPRLTWAEYSSRSPVQPIGNERAECPVVLSAKSSGQVLH